MAESLKDKSIKGISWSFAEQILTRGVNFVVGIILARLLSPTDYGLIGMLAVFLAISQLFIDGGLASALIREKDASENDYSTVFIINVTLSIVFYFILFFTSPAIARFYGQPMLESLLRVMALSFVIGAVTSVHGTLLTKRVDFKTKSIISFLASIVSGSIGIFCAFKGLGPWALVAQTLSSALTVTLLTLVIVHWLPRLVFSMESFKRLFSYSSKLLGASLIGTIYYNAYPMVIGKKFSAGDVGLFSRAGQFPNVVNDTFISTFNRVAFPVLSRIQDDDGRLLEVFEKYVQVFCFFTFPALLGLFGCAHPLVSLLLTDKWIACVPLMQLLCISLLPNGITIISQNLLYVKGRSDLVLRMEIIKKTVMTIVLFVSMFFGLKAMCYGIIVNSWIDFGFCSYYTKKILGYRMVQQLRNVAPYFFCSLVVLAESLLASYLIPGNLLSISVSVLLCAGTYFLITKLSKLYAFNEAMGLLALRKKRPA